MRKIYLLILLIVSFLAGKTFPAFAQSLVEKNSFDILFQPEPKEIIYLNKAFQISSLDELSIIAESIAETKAAEYLKHLLKEKFGAEIQIDSKSSGKKVKIVFESEEIKNSINKQQYEINFDGNENSIIVKSGSQIGLLFASVTLSELFEKKDDLFFINLASVKDYPDFSRRIISANPSTENIFALLDFALKNKIETIAIASRQYPWYEVSENYKNLFAKIKVWKDKFGGPSIMQMHNIYEEKHIEISNENDINGLKEVIKTGIEYGADKLMILADDTPPFKFGDGYILTSENDKQKFKHMAEAHCYLMSDLKKWINENSFESELYYVPPFYTYEDMHYGDIELFKNTQWEKSVYEPLYRDLNYIGANMPEDIFIIWTGPYVRSRKISEDDLKDWAKNLNGRIPFLWDNTIYSHNPYISSPMFSAWDNDFPNNFNSLTAGSGIFVNGDVCSEDSKVSAVTVNDYMWNSKNYVPGNSSKTAMKRIYGEEYLSLIYEFKDAELNLRNTIGERKLWFESDTLWSVIRKIRFITEKNPFDYHLNYTRLKALRLQLKNSAPEPVDKKLFINKCEMLYSKRNEVLEKLKMKLPEVAESLKKITVELPDFEKIQ